MEFTNHVEFAYDGIDEAFPAVDPGVQPFGSRVLCQVRVPKSKTKGGIILTSDARETEHYNTQVAKVVAVGPLAFRNRNTMEQWPEGSWCAPGEFIRTPRYGGDRWSVRVRDKDGKPTEDEVIFVIFNDLDIIGKISGDPLAIKAYL